ncbi:2-oxoacid dehydrogenases acyltransferase-domain-containing protein [Glomus cerebriforme]|uniref:Dihydrolipoamide acetyltransferase component of pyruvate dehydrogenase complex n=1 Tax=Glomus cerebriforme TaxID=658196 RepID=A0A397T3T6_9GLOM|nr:2-oxoacid dehydrogenases acyltransferase-domain-containing protein [Glomus cerebriforme]
MLLRRFNAIGNFQYFSHRLINKNRTKCNSIFSYLSSLSIKLKIPPTYAYIKISNSSYCARDFHSSYPNNAVISFLLADIGEGITECEVVQWFIQPGDSVSEFDKICEVQSDKASVEITSRYTGTIKKLHHKVGEMAKVGNPIVDIETDSSISEPELSEINSDVSPLPSTQVQEIINIIEPSVRRDKVFSLATPAVRRIAREHHVDISNIKGNGKNGRVTKEDVLNYVAMGKKAQPSSEEEIVNTTYPKDKLVPLSMIQKSMFKTMTRSLKIPHLGYSDEYVLDNVIAFRNSINDYIAKNNHFSFNKISFMPIFIKSFSIALKQFPILNACVIDGDDANTAKLKFRGSHNISIAMDTPGGLVVPNIKNIQAKSIFEIASDIQRLQEAGKKNTISPNDFQEGTITLSNIGIIGGSFLSPVVVSSEVCIAAIGKIQKVPRFENVKDEVTGQVVEKIVGKHITTVSFCADHRVIDGATVARFSEKWKNLLENPVLLSAELR